MALNFVVIHAETHEFEIGKPNKQTRIKGDDSADDNPVANTGGDGKKVEYLQTIHLIIYYNCCHCICTIESDDGDGDATAARMANRGLQHATYDAPDEDDEEIIMAIDKSLEQQEAQLDVETEENYDDNSDDEDNESRKSEFTAAEKRQKAREDRILGTSAYVKKYRFDSRDGAWAEIEMQVRMTSM